MAGLEQFVRRSPQDGTNPPRQTLRQDRAAAKDLKIPINQNRPSATQRTSQPPNHPPVQDSYARQYTHSRGNDFDDTVTSGIESVDGQYTDHFVDGPASGKEDYANGVIQAKGSMPGPQATGGGTTAPEPHKTSLPIKQSRGLEYGGAQSHQTPGKPASFSGRFQGNPPQKAKSYGGAYEDPIVSGYNKRGRSTEVRGHKSDYQPALERIHGHIVENDEDQEVTVDLVKPEPTILQNKSARALSNVNNYSEDNPNNQQLAPSSPSESDGKLDHDDDTLRKMSYDQLAKEDFDEYPKPPPSGIPADVRNSEVSIADRMKCCMEIDKAERVSGESRVLEEFFSQLSRREWEEAGDWLIDGFADTLKAFKDARRKKRDLVMEYENTVQEREQVVKQKYQALDLEMSRMKEKGMKVVKAGKIN